MSIATHYFVHPTAIVDQGAVIGANAKIWHFSHVMSGARIGPRCILGQNVFVASGVEIGENVKIQNNVSIYEGVVLEDDVFCGPSMVFTNVRNPRSEIVRKGEYIRTLVRRGATLGANSTVVCGVTLGHYAFIGAGTVVTKDVPDFALVVGVPARQIGWMSAFGERLPKFDSGGTALCPGTGERYQLIDGRVIRIDSQPQRPSDVTTSK